jgi:hypothetical protein
MGGAPAGYAAADYGRDFKTFHAFVRQAAPEMLILGPGSVGETTGSKNENCYSRERNEQYADSLEERIVSRTTETCPKCKGTMIQGFILDNAYGARLVST